MSNKSKEVFAEASRILYRRHDRYQYWNYFKEQWETAETHWKDKFQPLSQVYREYRREHIAAIIRASSNVITTQQTIPLTAFKEVHTLNLVDFPGKHRDGRRRDNWWIEGVQEYWTQLTTYKTINELGTQSPPRFPALHNQPLDLSNKTHISILELAAYCNIELKHENANLNTITMKTKMLLGWLPFKWSKFNQKRKVRNGKNNNSNNKTAATTTTPTTHRFSPNQWRPSL